VAEMMATSMLRKRKWWTKVAFFFFFLNDRREGKEFDNVDFLISVVHPCS
jgi:hypothetical protein